MQNRQCDNLCVKLIEGGRRCNWNRNGLSDSVVGSGMIVVLDIFRDILQQLPFAEDKEEVQTLAAQTAQETFAKRIRTRGRKGRAKDFNPHTDRDPVESRAIFAVIVADEKAGAFPKGRCLPQLLRQPDLAGMARDRDMHDPPRGQLDDDKNENVPKPEIMRSGKETTLPSPPPLGTAREPFVIHAARASHLPLCDVTGHGFSTGKC